MLAQSLAGPAPQAPAGAAPQPGAPPVVFGSEVELVTVDAVVVDKQGAPVAGLKREDFVLTEDDQPQIISSFEAVSVSAGAPPDEPVRRPPIATNVGAAGRMPRLFAVVFDDMHMTAIQAQRAKQAVAEFLRTGVSEGDRVVLAATSGGAWWSARMTEGRGELVSVLKRFEGRRIVDYATQDRMTDYEAMRIENYHDSNVAARVERRFESAGLTQQMTQSEQDTVATGIANPYVEMRARQAYDEARVRNRLTLRTLRRILEALTLAKGRKSLILVSEGFVHDTFLEEFKDVVRASRRANTPLYFVDTRGLEGAFSPESAEFGTPIALQDLGPMFADMSREGDGSRVLSDETGGFTVHNTNDLAAGIARIARESQCYYLLGYNPHESFQDGRYRKLDVRVNRKGVTVRARRGYYSPSPVKPREEDEPQGVDQPLQQALDAPFDLDALPLRMSAYVFGETLLDRAKVVVAADAEIRNLAFVEQEGRLVDSLDALLVVAHRESGEYFQYPETINMRLRPQTLSKSDWYPMVRDVDLAPGTYLAKLVVRDKNSGKIGSLSYTFEVPELGAFRASTPIITDTVVPSEEDPGVPRTVAVAHRSFRAAGRLYCQLEVFNAQRDSESGQPRVTFGFALLGADGTVVRDDPPSLITPSSKGVVSRLLGIGIDGVPPGDYKLVIHLKDEVDGKTLELGEPLTLDPAPETSEAPAPLLADPSAH